MKKETQTLRIKRHLKLEKIIDNHLNEKSGNNTEIDDSIFEIVSEVAERLQWLRRQYFRTGNPVHVWHAINTAHFASSLLRRPLELPKWVQAYLVRAASEIMCVAVGAPEGDRSGAWAPPQSSDSRTHISRDTQPGLTSRQRTAAAIEALRFGDQGANPFCTARNELARQNRVGTVTRLKGGKAANPFHSASKSQNFTGHPRWEDAVKASGIPEYSSEDGLERFKDDRKKLQKGRT